MAVQRVAVISMHTCPLEQPGTGDSGGLNVYVMSLAYALSRRGIQTDIFTRKASSLNSPVVLAARESGSFISKLASPTSLRRIAFRCSIPPS